MAFYIDHCHGIKISIVRAKSTASVFFFKSSRLSLHVLLKEYKRIYKQYIKNIVNVGNSSLEVLIIFQSTGIKLEDTDIYIYIATIYSLVFRNLVPHCRFNVLMKFF